MTKQPYDNEVMTQYLLGALGEDETERLDELSFADDRFAFAMRVAEKDLVDSYVYDELEGSVLDRFKSHYLASPLRREKMEFARAFQRLAEKSVAQTAQARAEDRAESTAKVKGSGWLSSLKGFLFLRPALQWGLAASALLFLAAGVWLMFENARLKRQVAQIEERQGSLAARDRERQKEIEGQQTARTATQQELARERAERERLEEQLKKEQEQQQRLAQERRSAEQKQKQSSSAGVSIASFVLAPQMRSSGQIPVLSILSKTDYVALQLQLEPNDYAAYQVALMDQAGNQTLWRSARLKARAAGDSKSLNISFRAALLRAETYVVRVSGITASGASEILSDYPFRIVK